MHRAKLIQCLIFALSIGLATAQLSSETGLRFFGSFGNYQPLPKSGLGRLHIAPSFATGALQSQYLDLNVRGDFRIGDDLVVYVNLPIKNVRANGVTQHTALSDPLIALGYEFPFNMKANFTLNAGFVLPSQNANRLDLGMALPMAYQSSLGSTDLLVGFTFEHEGLLMGLAFQQPLTENGNRYINIGSPFGAPTSNYLRRGADLSLRLRQSIKLSRSVDAFFNVIPIIRVSDDRIIDENFEVQVIQKSKGQTLNGSVGFVYSFRKYSYLIAEVGMPIYYRQVFADGSQRYFFAEIRLVRDLQVYKRKSKANDSTGYLGASAT